MARGLRRYGGIETWLDGLRDRALLAFTDFGGRALSTTTEGIDIGFANFVDGSASIATGGGAGGVANFATGSTGDSQAAVLTDDDCVLFAKNPRFLIQYITASLQTQLKVNAAGFFETQDCSDWVTATQEKACFRSLTNGDFEAVTGGGSAETVTNLSAFNNGFGIYAEIRVSGDGATVEFFIDGALVATHTTNLPSGALFAGAGVENNTTFNVFAAGHDMMAVEQERGAT